MFSPTSRAVSDRINRIDRMSRDREIHPVHPVENGDAEWVVNEFGARLLEAPRSMR
jgi:hypothetical protein